MLVFDYIRMDFTNGDGLSINNHIESHEYHGLSIGIVYQRSCFYGLQIRFPQKKRPNINLVGGLVAIFGIFPEILGFCHHPN